MPGKTTALSVAPYAQKKKVGSRHLPELEFDVPPLRQIAEKLGLFDTLRYSRLYPFYDRFMHPHNEKHLQLELLFYSKLLEKRGAGASVFDVGANQGQKSEIFLRLGFKVIALEPDKKNASHLRKQFRRSPELVVIEKAVSDNIGEAEFYSVSPGSAYNSLEKSWAKEISPQEVSSFSVPTTTLPELITEFGLPYFVKIDVEGHEANVVRGLRLPVPVISLESNLSFRAGTIECVEHLNRISTRYQFCRTNNLDFDSLKWQPANEFLEDLKGARDTYFEVFARITG